MAQILRMVENTEQVFWFTFEIGGADADAPHESGFLLISSGVGDPFPIWPLPTSSLEPRRDCTRDDTNWLYGSAFPSSFEFVLTKIDAVVVSGKNDPMLDLVLQQTRITLRNEHAIILERHLGDIVCADSALAYRVDAIEKFLNEFMRLDDPAAKAMRALGAKLLGEEAKLSPVLFQRGNTMRVHAEWGPLPCPRGPITIRVRLHGIQRRDVT